MQFMKNELRSKDDSAKHGVAWRKKTKKTINIRQEGKAKMTQHGPREIRTDPTLGQGNTGENNQGKSRKDGGESNKRKA